MAALRLFASVRIAAGAGRDHIDAPTVGEVIDAACERYGSDFAELVPTCRVWVNGQPAERDDAVSEDDEVALLPPVSGG